MKKIFLISLLLFASCATNAPGFNWQPEIWAADSKTQSIVRFDDQENLQIIKTSDPKFDEFICIKKEEPRKVVEEIERIISKCKVWE